MKQEVKTMKQEVKKTTDTVKRRDTQMKKKEKEIEMLVSEVNRLNTKVDDTPGMIRMRRRPPARQERLLGAVDTTRGATQI